MLRKLTPFLLSFFLTFTKDGPWPWRYRRSWGGRWPWQWRPWPFGSLLSGLYGHFAHACLWIWNQIWLWDFSAKNCSWGAGTELYLLYVLKKGKIAKSNTGSKLRTHIFLISFINYLSCYYSNVFLTYPRLTMINYVFARLIFLPMMIVARKFDV